MSAISSLRKLEEAAATKQPKKGYLRPTDDAVDEEDVARILADGALKSLSDRFSFFSESLRKKLFAAMIPFVRENELDKKINGES